MGGCNVELFCSHVTGSACGSVSGEVHVVSVCTAQSRGAGSLCVQGPMVILGNVSRLRDTRRCRDEVVLGCPFDLLYFSYFSEAAWLSR